MKRTIYALFMALGVLMTACKKDNDGSASGGDPMITAISPEQGHPLSTLTIQGENFSRVRAENRVEINGVEARIIHFNEHTIHVEVPEEGSTGSISVIVGGRSASGPVFTYMAAPAIYRAETYAGTGEMGYAEGPRQSALLNRPGGVVFDSKGNLIFSDRNNNRIRKVSPDGQVSLVAGTGAQGRQDGPADQATFAWPYGIAIDKDDNIYVADRNNHLVRKIDAVTGMVSTLAGSTQGYAEGRGAEAQFNQPLDVAVANDGTVYVADYNNSRIRSIAPDGTVSTYVGDGVQAYRDGPRETAQVNRAPGVDIDRDGNLIIADRFNYCVRKVTPDGMVTTIAGSRSRQYGHADGPEAEALFFGIWGVHAADDGHIYIAEINDNHAIRVLTPEGEVRTLGGGGQSGFVNGEPSTTSRYNTPVGLALDGEGNIYVADLENHAIRRLIRTN
ncbi:SMP-30/gluconolactonase/LRE family protein [Parapedobacter sp. ISTM3]|uniref:IPT/TIG domain-containing protein n=1 Tax=Parapedobacter sp. ISTM3 TaxID=2800130 RepID=UPI001907BAE4|nr:IPT/TIG domain-containing protein [Parapedobacter sp. ISTM3]MBK1439122.1 SMP-30/gluconolactonase/LRE family protein [Parapedobacter sp. ISTM3]